MSYGDSNDYSVRELFNRAYDELVGAAIGAWAIECKTANPYTSSIVLRDNEARVFTTLTEYFLPPITVDVGTVTLDDDELQDEDLAEEPGRPIPICPAKMRAIIVLHEAVIRSRVPLAVTLRRQHPVDTVMQLVAYFQTYMKSVRGPS